ncbi:hypothetical protein FACS1894190_12500 [Spirochaetia bacterium]|nr:hypothetical protein FACS1894190_12500 [Spirochaetia bacterium]
MQSNQIENRQIWVFISSTFRDLQDGWDYLVMKIRRHCKTDDIFMLLKSSCLLFIRGNSDIPEKVKAPRKYRTPKRS